MDMHRQALTYVQQGILLVLAYVVFSSGNAVYLSGFLASTDVYGTLFFVFTLMAVVFGFAVKAQGGLRLAWRDGNVLIALVGVNLTTAGSWLSFFFAVRSIEPALTSVIGSAVVPLTTLLFSTLVLGIAPRSRAQWTAATALLACMVLSAWVVFSGRTALSESTPLVGYVGSVVCGLSVALNTLISKRLNNLGAAPSEILATRFFLLIAIAALMADWDGFLMTFSTHCLDLVLIAVAGNLAPVYFLQSGLSRLPPIATGFLIGLSPVVYLVFQSFANRFSFAPVSVAAICISTVIILYGVWVSSRSAPATVNRPLSPAGEQ